MRNWVTASYAYLADGRDGLAIVDVERPEKPRLYMVYNAGGRLNDARDVVIGATNASLFAYVAAGANGLKVIQLMSPESQPNFYGFAAEPKPELIAWYRTTSPALALSRGVDETGHQIAVFGRIGSRPFTLDEMKKFYLGPDGRLFAVTDRVKVEDFVARGRRCSSAPRIDVRKGLRPAVLFCGIWLAGCHGSTLDAIYPGSLGHTPPPAINLPSSDCPETTGEWNTCGAYATSLCRPVDVQAQRRRADRRDATWCPVIT